MRRVVAGDATSEEAVKLYHDGLAKAGGAPIRALEDDLQITESVLKQAA